MCPGLTYSPMAALQLDAAAPDCPYCVKDCEDATCPEGVKEQCTDQCVVVACDDPNHNTVFYPDRCDDPCSLDFNCPTQVMVSLILSSLPGRGLNISILTSRFRTRSCSPSHTPAIPMHGRTRSMPFYAPVEVLLPLLTHAVLQPSLYAATVMPSPLPSFPRLMLPSSMDRIYRVIHRLHSTSLHISR